MSTLSTAKMTSKQYLMLGEDPPGVRLELAYGEIVVSPSPTPDHSEVVLNLTQILGPHIKRARLGKIYLDTDTVFDDENTRRPDIIFFASHRLHLVGARALMGAPDLCVEILSPSSEYMDREEKFALYEKHGVPAYWIVDQETRTVEAFGLKGGKYQLAVKAHDNEVVRLPPFMDLEIHLADVWPER